MTTTEDRLTDALHAAARSVTAPSLRPLGETSAPRPAPADRTPPPLASRCRLGRRHRPDRRHCRGRLGPPAHGAG